ncbi:DUF1292 domain-containing protein [Nitrosospira sp. NRS527]|uniref:DUF1292 domain-containing protein n=1 Tax=Nitrosospira sp. NRS527 TaxID=155925 RepID=UPI001AFB5DBF|nr:DUF1292 domain-containing protein [Nitrosospira sp. NRS527]BCT67688.1 hypothetical protein NNRS527_01275 [Nitrosospira sp. NRS527]
MIWPVVLIPILIIVSLTASAMQIDADPRVIVSFMDKSLSPELDILSVATDISADNHLVFQVKTRGERTKGEAGDHLLLRILNGKTYGFLIPINQEDGDKVLMYESVLQHDSTVLPQALEMSRGNAVPVDLNAKRIVNGAEFVLPVDWVNFGKDFDFDAYTVKAHMQGNIVEITEIYDQAGKGRDGRNTFSAVTLLNKLCTPQRLRSSQ